MLDMIITTVNRYLFWAQTQLMLNTIRNRTVFHLFTSTPYCIFDIANWRL